MKNISMILNGVLLVAVAALFVLHFTREEKHEGGAEETKITENTSGSQEMKVAYVYIDSLLTHFKMAQDMSEDLLKRKEKYFILFKDKE